MQADAYRQETERNIRTSSKNPVILADQTAVPLRREILMNRQEFRMMTENRILLLDGATGTEMMKRGMPRNTCAEAWILDHGDLLLDLERAYAQAGSQVVYAPTFSANRISLKKHGLEKDVERLNTGLVELTRKAVGQDVLVAGDMTTPGEPLDPLGDLQEEELYEAYREQAEALYQAGADLIVAETLMALREAELALQAVRSVCSLPFMATMTVQEDGRAWFGGTAVELVKKMAEQGADAAGINCSSGPRQLEPVVRAMAVGAEIPVIVKPNAGLPVMVDGSAVYDMKPEDFVREMKKLVQDGASILGGCCGTTPEFIRMLRANLL